jgi:hypothetical protein
MKKVKGPLLLEDIYVHKFEARHFGFIFGPLKNLIIIFKILGNSVWMKYKSVNFGAPPFG